MLLILMKTVLELCSADMSLRSGLRGHENKEVERGNIYNCSQDKIYKTKEGKNRLVDRQRKISFQETVF